MYLNSNLLAQLMLSQLPGLVGALQPAAAGPANLSEMARRQRNQNNASAMLSAASGLLTPSPNRYPLGALQRLGAGLGATLQSHTDGANQVSILDALGMEGRGGQSRASATARSGAPGLHAQARRHGAPVPAALAAGPASEAPVRRPKLRQFTGTVANRLEHPPVLPGGWKLYGYEQDTGSPVYVGPGQQLRIYT